MPEPAPICTSSGLPNVRYVKIVDQNDDEDPNEAGQYDGFDLDAIGSPQALALFNADETSGEIPLTVNFTDQSTGNPTSWDWDFGDGDTSTEQNPTHVYDETGEYTVTLTIDGPAGSDTMVRTNYISAYEGAPAADFSGTPTTGTLPLEVTFTSTSTGTISTYYWEFGDGQTSDQENPVHTYTEPGNYPVRLTVTGPGGSDNKLRLNYIHANCPAPVADFTADVTTGDAPLTVTFTNTTDVPDACPATYQWDFGDGNISTEENPTNVYTDDGVYTVKLTAGNAGGSDAEEKVDFITVGD
nr:PKD domain-containing protein [bacterium]